MNLYDYILNSSYLELISIIMFFSAILIFVNISRKNKLIIILFAFGMFSYFLQPQYYLFLVIIDSIVLFILFLEGDIN